jgi:hypothetical protein
MKRIPLFLLTVLLLVGSGCKQKTTTSAEQGQEDTVLQTDFTLPTSIDFEQDISSLSLQALRLLRTSVYARHGMYFTEAELYAYFTANTNWYESLVDSLYYADEDNVPLTYDAVSLSKEEQAFVDRVDKRIEEMQTNNFILRDGYRLGNADNIVNLYQFKAFDPLFMEKITRHNFVIVEAANRQLFHLYEENDYRQIPSFITTDLFLQAFHMYFSYILKSLEQEKFIPILTDLCFALYSESMRLAGSETDAAIKDMAQFNAVFYAIPYYFLTNEKLEVPASYQDSFLAEIENINDQEDRISDFLSFTDAAFSYSLFKPRGHYTRKPVMEAYFKAMMWLQTAPFCRDKEEQLRQAVFSAAMLTTAYTEDNEPVMDLYQAIFEPIVFLVGLPDNLSVMDIADFLQKEHIGSLQAALSTPVVDKVNRMLLELTKTRNEIKPKIEVSCPDKINFMPQRYLIDSDVIQNLTDVTPNSKRAYPKGLDAFATFGSETANDLLTNFYKEKENWDKYPAEMERMKKKFSNYQGWNSSVYNKWIESLLELQKKDKNYPGFMQTNTWGLKNMNTSLASWAELKHDAILYGEQPAGAECGGGGLPPPVVKGYVEPNLRFWNKLDELIKLSTTLMKKHNLLTPDLEEKANELADYSEFLITATRKELAGELLSENEFNTIQYMGSSIEYFTLSVIDPDFSLFSWELVQGPDKSVAVVADIYTRNVPDCSKNGILHVATGNANNIYVVVEIGGYLYLTRGATFSYYEFTEELGTRLTDEEWQERLEGKEAPPIPEWMHEIIIGTEPQTDDRVFYSSGC